MRLNSVDMKALTEISIEGCGEEYGTIHNPHIHKNNKILYVQVPSITIKTAYIYFYWKF
jgi:hypothetical protein